MNNFEKHITTQLQNDQLNFTAGAAIHDRLSYHMQLKSAKATVRRNAILPALGAVLTAKMITWKLGIAAMLLISFMGYKQINQNSTFIYSNDTAQVIQSFDTINMRIKDSLSIN